ncbi:MAG: hypothetical protein NVS9B15_18370 [Acidobacteriaceae bacterium]
MSFLLLFAAFLAFIILPLATRSWEGWRYRGSSEWPSVEGEIVGGFLDADASEELPAAYRPVLSYQFEAEGAIRHGTFSLRSMSAREDAQLLLEHWLTSRIILVAYEPGNPAANKPLISEEEVSSEYLHQSDLG